MYSYYIFVIESKLCTLPLVVVLAELEVFMLIYANISMHVFRLVR